MSLIIRDKTSTVKHKNLSAVSGRLIVGLEGRKNWAGMDKLTFESTESNIRLVKSLVPGVPVEDQRGIAQAFDTGEEAKPKKDVTEGEWNFRMVPRDFQLENFKRFKDKLQYAIFSEQGTGKTKVSFDIISYRWLSNMITGVLILSSPKGVHSQWIEEQMPKHLWKGIEVDAAYWDGKKEPSWFGQRNPGKLQIYSGNIDMVSHDRSYKVLEKFVAMHGSRLKVIVDESDSIKNPASVRSKRLRKLVEPTMQRSIMTGTPIAKDLTDEWGQFLFLNERIIGIKYITAFRSQYCLMGGFENRQVVGHRNVEQFKSMTSPHVFRATKKDLDLPEKIYDEVVFDLSDEQKRHMRELKDEFITTVNGAEANVSNAAALLIRMQQISCGYLVDDEKAKHELTNPRIDVLMKLSESISGKCIIWCRFNHDIELIKHKLGEGAVSIYGKDSQKDRAESKERFLSDQSVKFLVASPAAAGKGVDGLQKVCSDAIYYSNSFNAIDRWQSEDRIHRIGMKGTATYFDLIARGSLDRHILKNLRNKKSLSDFVLDDMKLLAMELE